MDLSPEALTFRESRFSAFSARFPTGPSREAGDGAFSTRHVKIKTFKCLGQKKKKITRPLSHQSGEELSLNTLHLLARWSIFTVICSTNLELPREFAGMFPPRVI